MSDRTDREHPIPEELEKAIRDPKIPINPQDPLEQINDAYSHDPMPSNADNTAVDPMGNIHSGSAIPDPIGDTLEEETDEESREYYREDILDEDPVLGSPRGVANLSNGTDLITDVADEDENVLDRLEQAIRERKE